MDPVSTFTAGVNGLTKLVNFIRGSGIEKHMPSLTAYAHQANVMGRVYIEESIAQDDIAIPLMSILNQMYCCWIITALGIDSRCADGRTVRSRLQLVSGESLSDRLLNDINDNFGVEKRTKQTPSFEAKVIDMDPVSQRLVCGRLIELDFLMETVTEKVGDTVNKTGTVENNASQRTINSSSSSNSNQNGRTYTTTNPLSYDPDNPDKTSTSSTSTSTSTAQRTTEQQKGGSAKTAVSNVDTKESTTMKGSMARVYMYVQLVPYILKTEVANQFMSLNFTPTLSQRIQQLRAGEISFIKDFIFARDLIKKQSTALRKDNTGIVNEMLIRQRNSLFRWVVGLTQFLPERHNLANAILILNKQTFDQTCREAHIDFDNYISRNKFFLKTFSMVMCVVDPMYGTMKMYFAGIPTVGTYSYAMVNKVGSTGKDSFDLKEVMTAFSQGQAPRF